MAIAFYSAPAAEQARSMEDMGVTYEPWPRRSTSRKNPANGWSTVRFSLFSSRRLAIAYLRREVANEGAAVILELNHYVFLFLIAGMLLHWRPRSFVRAIAAARAVGGRRAHPVPALRRHREDDDRVGAGGLGWRSSSSPSRRRTRSRARRHLLGISWAVHPVGRRQVADRSAVPARGRARRCTCTSDGWCRPTTPPRRSPT